METTKPKSASSIRKNVYSDQEIEQMKAYVADFFCSYQEQLEKDEVICKKMAAHSDNQQQKDLHIKRAQHSARELEKIRRIRVFLYDRGAI